MKTIKRVKTTKTQNEKHYVVPLRGLRGALTRSSFPPFLLGNDTGGLELGIVISMAKEGSEDFKMSVPKVNKGRRFKKKFFFFGQNCLQYFLLCFKQLRSLLLYIPNILSCLATQNNTFINPSVHPRPHVNGFS